MRTQVQSAATLRPVSDSTRTASTRTDSTASDAEGGSEAAISSDQLPAARLGVRELRANLADAVRRANSGESTIITSDGAPVARLGPIDAAAPQLDQLLASGAVLPPRRTSRWRPPEPVTVWAGTRIDQAIRDLRG